MMSDEITTLSSFQFVIGGNLETVRSALIKSMLMNSIPYSQGENSALSSHRDSADVFQLYSPRWLPVGRNELDQVDHSQVFLRFCLPAFPIEAEIEFHESGRASAFTTLPVSAVDLPERTLRQWPDLGVVTKNGKRATTYLLPIPELLSIAQTWDDLVRSNLPLTSPWYAPISARWGSQSLEESDP